MAADDSPNLAAQLKQLGEMLNDERVKVIAEQRQRGERYVPVSAEDLTRSQWAFHLDHDRRRSLGNRHLEKPSTGIGRYEQNRLRQARQEKETRVDSNVADQEAAKEQPFVEMVSDAHRRACVDALGGEATVWGALAQYYRMFDANRVRLSLDLAATEYNEKLVRPYRDRLWELLVGVRRLAAEARGLGAPEDVLVGLDAWHYRVREMVITANPLLPQWIKEVRRLRKGQVAIGPPARLKNHRQRLEKLFMRRHVSAAQVAILETAWLLPVELHPDGSWGVVRRRSGSKHPHRPSLETDASITGAVEAISRFYAGRLKALKALNRPTT